MGGVWSIYILFTPSNFAPSSPKLWVLKFFLQDFHFCCCLTWLKLVASWGFAPTPPLLHTLAKITPYNPSFKIINSSLSPTYPQISDFRDNSQNFEKIYPQICSTECRYHAIIDLICHWTGSNTLMKRCHLFELHRLDCALSSPNTKQISYI